MDPSQMAAYKEYQAHRRTESNATVTTETDASETEPDDREQENEEEEEEEVMVNVALPSSSTGLSAAPLVDRADVGAMVVSEEEHVLEEEEVLYETDDALMSVSAERVVDCVTMWRLCGGYVAAMWLRLRVLAYSTSIATEGRTHSLTRAAMYRISDDAARPHTTP